VTGPVEVHRAVDVRGRTAHRRVRHSRHVVHVGILALASYCAGCAGLFNPAAERSVALSGVVTNVAQESSCTLRLVEDNGRLVGQLEVQPSFRRSFVIAPGKRSLCHVEVTCAGSLGGVKSQSVWLERGREQVDLGSIVLH
jgi:hypothetical protein